MEFAPAVVVVHVALRSALGEEVGPVVVYPLVARLVGEAFLVDMHLRDFFLDAGNSTCRVPSRRNCSTKILKCSFFALGLHPDFGVAL